MQNSAFSYKKRNWFALRLLGTCLFIFSGYVNGWGQECPPNIDFEKGDFSGWVCYTGYVASVNDQNIISLYPSNPEYDRHTMYTANPAAAPLTDFYGHFPVNCPNGSGHSIRLGNNRGGGEAEGVSYEFTIPAGRDVYSLIYHYAVVFQDPDHLESQQPRMEIEITDVTDDQVIQCSSFTFHPYGSVLPGFFLSDNPGGETPVWCKDWSAVSINLDNKAGKTIRLFFKTADCTFKRHFGYAYLDVNSECSSEFVGATYCHDDTAVTVVAPYGYQSYKWYDHNFTSVLGTSQTLRLDPPPSVGTTIAVELIPFDGYGCLDTLYAKLVDTLKVRAIAGPDMLSCNFTPVQLGSPPKQGIVYHWSPTVGLSNPEVSNPVANPQNSTQYVLTSNSFGGGCKISDTVIVKSSIVDTSLQLIGKAAYCITSGDSAILQVKQNGSIQWFMGNLPIAGAVLPDYRATSTGAYHALLVNNHGCSLATSQKNITIDIPRPGIVYPLKYAVKSLPLSLAARQFGDTVVWNPGVNLDNAKTYNPVFRGTVDQLYRIDITTFSGCLTQDTQFVKIVEHVEVYVPNAFTPNNDGHNDYLKPLSRGLKETRYFRIYNRWGQLLYEMNSEEDRGWDGTIHGNPLSSQTVVWVLEGVGVDNQVYKRTGSTVLIH